MQIQYALERGASCHLSSAIDLGRYSHCALLSDPLVATLYGQAIRSQLPEGSPLFIVPAGEEAKSLHYAEVIWTALQAANLPRSTLLIALGGGALCDLANFVGGCYLRGIDTLLIPTTLLAMVDAAIGGKCGVNLGPCKNAIGLIRQPKLTLIDPALLETLPQEEFRAGMAEIVKAGLIGDPDLVTLLETNRYKLTEILERAINVKRAIVERDEREESGERALLNLGHTFGHAIEATMNWKIRHGEAVAIGLICAAQLSLREGTCSPDLPSRIERLCASLGLPTRIPPELAASELLPLMQKDKKNFGSGVTCVLLNGVGSAFVKREVNDSKIKSLLIDLGAKAR